MIWVLHHLLTVPSPQLVVVILNHLGAVHAEGTVLCPLLEEADPSLELVVYHGRFSLHKEVTEEVFNVLYELDVEAYICATVAALFLEIEVYLRLHLDPERADKAHSRQPVSNDGSTCFADLELTMFGLVPSLTR